MKNLHNKIAYLGLFALFNLGLSWQAMGANEPLATTKISEPPLTIELPANMKENKQKTDKGFYLYQYATADKKAPSNLIIKIIAAADRVPADKANYELWQVETLTSQLTHLVEEYNLSMNNVKSPEKVLGNKGENVKLGEYTYKGMQVTFGTTEAQFLNIFQNNKLYIFTLVSTDPDAKLRKKNLENLMEQMKTVQFLSTEK